MSLPVGTVLWREPKTVAASGAAQNTRPVLPADSTSAHSVFAGIVCRDGEPETGVITVATGGNALALVLGPVSAGATVYKVNGVGYLGTDVTVAVGVCLEAVAAPGVPGTPTLAKISIKEYAGGSSSFDLPVGLMTLRTIEVIGGVATPKHRQFMCTEYF